MSTPTLCNTNTPDLTRKSSASILMACKSLSRVPTQHRNTTPDGGLDEKQTATEETLPVSVVDLEFPDGGVRAWLVVFGTTCITFSTFGYVNAWGVFQSYYETNTLSNYSSSRIAWIGSVQYALVYLPGLIVGRLFDLGWFRIPFAVGSALIVVSTFLIAQCTEYWHFILCQGILVGASCGVCFGPVVGLVGNWFKKRRGFALAIAALGASVGGTVFPIVARTLIPKIGFPWTMRVLGFILAFMLGIANLTARRRIPPKNISGGIFNFKAFKSAAFTVYCFSTLVSFLGLYTLLTFIDISAVSVGISAEFSFYLVSIANAGSGLGRLFTGLLVDRFGAVNVVVPMTTIAAIITYAWPFAHTKDALIVVATLYGFTTGAYVSTFQMPLYELGDIEDVGRRAGMLMSFSAFGAVAGPPISGAISRATGGFTIVGYYAGSMILLSCAMMLMTRHLVLRRLLGRF